MKNKTYKLTSVITLIVVVGLLALGAGVTIGAYQTAEWGMGIVFAYLDYKDVDLFGASVTRQDALKFMSYMKQYNLELKGGNDE